MKYLLDTCLVSELVRKRPVASVASWVSRQDEYGFYLSVLTLGEIRKGIDKLRDERRKQSLNNWLEEDLRQRFQDRILPIDDLVSLAWGKIQAEGENKGKTLPVVDSLIAATAIVHDLTVVSRNVSDIEICGAQVINPWEDGI